MPFFRMRIGRRRRHVLLTILASFLAVIKTRLFFIPSQGSAKTALLVAVWLCGRAFVS